MARLLADTLPLRRGTDLAGAPPEAVLPWVYGRVTLAPIALGALTWLVADHPILAVTSVRDDTGALDGWELIQRLDASGQPIATLRLTREPAGTLLADVAGKRDGWTGALIEAPDAIVADILDRCGLAAGDWSDLRSGWPGVALGGVLNSAQPVREALAVVLASIGARWSATPMRAWAPDSGAVVATLGASAIDDAVAESSAEGLATRVTVTWGHSWATGEPAGTVVAVSTDGVERYGMLSEELAAPWLRTERDATALAAAALARRARPQWEAELTLGPGEHWRPGDRVTLDHPLLPAGTWELARLAIDDAGRRLTLIRAA